MIGCRRDPPFPSNVPRSDSPSNVTPFGAETLVSASRVGTRSMAEKTDSRST